jgi:UDP-GlcNAc:undecaprenyl-phosphate/decaprenyl-phosphate GlcNAc-1-phosphate transferase
VIDTWWYIVAFMVSLGLTSILTPFIKRVAIRFNIIDNPQSAPERKIHGNTQPLMGGLAIYLAFTITMFGLALISGQLVGDGMPWKYLFAITLGGLWLMIGGIIDDKRNLPASRQLIWPLLAVLTVIAGGIGIDYITNPMGGIISLNQADIDFLHIGETIFQITLWADVFAFIWLLGMMYTTKFLDGLDGLVSGITAIGSIFVFIISLQPEVSQPGTALLAAMLAGSTIGFLFFNWHPAKIFLGEGGSVYLGFMLGTISIIAGSKISTALLVMGIPILDVVWVIIRRLAERRSPFVGDKKHLHFRLIDAGFSHRKSVTFLLLLSAVFALAGLFVTGSNKLTTFGILAIVMVLLLSSLAFVYKIKHPENTSSDLGS